MGNEPALCLGFAEERLGPTVTVQRRLQLSRVCAGGFSGTSLSLPCTLACIRPSLSIPGDSCWKQLLFTILFFSPLQSDEEARERERTAHQVARECMAGTSVVRSAGWRCLPCMLVAALSLPCVQPLLSQDRVTRGPVSGHRPFRRQLSLSMASTAAVLVSGGVGNVGVGVGLPGLLRQGAATVQQASADLSEKVWQARHHLAAGAVGRCAAASMMFPVDTVKTRLQMFGVNCCSNQQWTEALRRPWFKGLPSSLLGQVPNGMLVFGSYEVYKRELRKNFPDLPESRVRLAAALLGDLTGSVWLAPFERTKQSIQAGLFSGVRESLRSVVGEMGVLGLYSGFKAQVLRDLAFHAIQLPLYEGIKDVWLARVHRQLLQVEGDTGIAAGRQPQQTELRPVESMVCGALAGATSGALTTPFDVLKTRLMTCSVDCANGSVRTTLANIYYSEGLLGLTSGMPQRALYIACGSAIFWTVFEQTVRMMKAVDALAAQR